MSAPLWTSAEVAAATGGRIHGDFAAGGITFDSREVAPGDLFVALKGASTDGHRFAAQALAAGAAGVLASQPVEGPHVL
ncbi:MAG: Mur ligase domain-containing protein, partial [Sphingomonadaceae bacterium]